MGGLKYGLVCLLLTIFFLSCSEQSPPTNEADKQKKYLVINSYQKWAKEYGATVESIRSKGDFINFWCKPETGSNVCGKAHPEERLEIISETSIHYQTSKGWITKSQVEKVEYGEAAFKTEGIELEIKSLDQVASIFGNSIESAKKGIPLTSKPEGGEITGRVYADEKVVATKVDGGIYHIKTKNSDFGWLHNKYVKEAKFK